MIRPLFLLIALALISGGSLLAAPKKKKPGNANDMWVTSPVPKLPVGVSHHTYQSESMNREVGFCLYLPPGYDSNTDLRYPVIYHLHGAGGNEFRSLYSAEILQQGIMSGKLPEIIMVFPNGGRSTLYQDSGDGRFMAETTVLRELLPLIDRTYRTYAVRGARCIEGFSMGGRGSTNLAMKHPELFGSLFNQSGNVYRVSDPSHLPFRIDCVSMDSNRGCCRNPELRFETPLVYFIG